MSRMKPQACLCRKIAQNSSPSLPGGRAAGTGEMPPAGSVSPSQGMSAAVPGPPALCCVCMEGLGMSESLLVWCCLATVFSGVANCPKELAGVSLVKVICLLGLVHKGNSRAKHVHQ